MEHFTSTGRHSLTERASGKRGRSVGPRPGTAEFLVPHSSFLGPLVCGGFSILSRRHPDSEIFRHLVLTAVLVVGVAGRRTVTPTPRSSSPSGDGLLPSVCRCGPRTGHPVPLPHQPDSRSRLPQFRNPALWCQVICLLQSHSDPAFSKNPFPLCPFAFVSWAYLSWGT